MAQTLAQTAPASRGITILSWVLQILLAAAFLAAGGAKLAGVPMMVDTFDHIGIGQWFRYVTGALEIAGGIALLVPGYAAFGAALLATVMVGAITAHILFLPSPAAPAVLLLVLCIAVVTLRRQQITARLA